MTDDVDPWENTKKLLGEDFFDRVEPTEDELREAVEAELDRSHHAGEPVSVLKALASLRGSGLAELRPGAYYGGDEQTARAMLARHDARRSRVIGEDDAAYFRL